jgi:hypothetical protein
MMKSIEQALFACEEYFRNAYYAQEAPADNGSIGRHTRLASLALEQVQHCLADAQRMLDLAAQRQDQHDAREVQLANEARQHLAGLVAATRTVREIVPVAGLSIDMRPICPRCAYELSPDEELTPRKSTIATPLGLCDRCRHETYAIGLFTDKDVIPPFLAPSGWRWNAARGHRGMWENGR